MFILTQPQLIYFIYLAYETNSITPITKGVLKHIHDIATTLKY
jgi:hypothetical protein